jgi:GNAT superfamily N-acetyltransferase
MDLIDEIGAYIEPAYRGRGIGRTLLSKCVEWCQLNEIPWIHVDFESANILARPFWLRFFTETMRSVRCTIYKDVLFTQSHNVNKSAR